MKTPTEMAEEAARQLQGSSQSLANLGEEFEELQNNDEFCNRLDELVFECEQCNNWFEMSEMAENDEDRWICESCNEE